MIKIEKLSKIFLTEEVETSALYKVDICINKGDFVAVMGPSGCGKSTLLNIMGLLDNPTEGTYYFDGQEVGSLHESQRTKLRRGNVGFVFQNFNLIDELNVFENVELPLNYLKMSSSERKHRVNEILDRMKMGHRAGHFPQQLSGGQQQRIAIARAVVANPKLVLADEPTGNLDSRNGIDVMTMLTELNRTGTTIVMVTHSKHDSGFAHRVINLFDGQIATEFKNSKVNEFSL
jgi:putative ABC transport system ATP-binding protein